MNREHWFDLYPSNLRASCAASYNDGEFEYGKTALRANHDGFVNLIKESITANISENVGSTKGRYQHSSISESKATQALKPFSGNRSKFSEWN